ncbi:MAG TPA: DUF4382 domain-containing protein [Burkholderiaceae bacterium]|nr:DUF4382 domain-containing protein [Burkholderiaceae bacterium]
MLISLHSTLRSRGAALVAALLLAACGGGGEINGTSSRSGTLNVSLTDAPACGFDAVNVTVQRVRVHPSETAEDTASGWIDIRLNPARKINLLNLRNGVRDTLGQTSIPEGRYNQIRLVLQSGSVLANSVVPSGGRETALDTPSALQSGIKLIHNFTVLAGQTVDLVLDFDACRSIVTANAGRYLLKPVVRALTTANGATISGSVPTALTVAGATLSLQTLDSNGRPVVVTATTPDAGSGTFQFAPVPAGGNYTLVAAAPGYSTVVVRNVPTSAGGTTAVGTLQQPPVSVMSQISGRIFPVGNDAAARAIQFLTGGPAIEVAYANAQFSTGQYALSVPINPPLVTTYTASGLPLFVGDTLVAGLYTLQASTPTQNAEVDISVGTQDVIQDFTF